MPDLTRTLVQRFVAPDDGGDLQATRSRYGLLEAWVSIVGNTLLFALKITLGLVSNSVSLIADAFHTLGDTVGSVVVVLGFRTARKPPDSKHPYGHGRAEPIATLVIAMLLVITAVEFGHQSYHRLLAPKPIKAGGVVVAAMLLSIVAKEWMARFSNRLAAIIGSDMLQADAWHHRSDAIAAGLVLLAMVGASFGYPWLDGLFGFGVSALIGLTGWHMGSRMISVLMGEAPDGELMQEIANTAASVRGVRGVHDVEVHDYGSTKHVGLHIEVAPETSMEESHATATSVEEALESDMQLSAVVHVDAASARVQPSALDTIRRVLEDLSATHPGVSSFHSLHTVTDSRGQYVEFHLAVDSAISLAESHGLVHDLTGHIAEETGIAKVNIHVEPADGESR